ncbi:PREDICTED: MATH domain and coiled-coil domain-containing protein At3g58370-like isoform X2 [Camelina sativa]|uniref:MATH domain and coiled-coil domain-containing protein At3g58370-like isoform X2 n=1 Tax=Camelina sativa TaxID=90675 RepID=A0ABM1QEA3_CAMSA|nr:PREDICTED: MATH domain and coiled-coil domain-containing protein At3g58370-like isoform X2 [Camelina sativa]
MGSTEELVDYKKEADDDNKFTWVIKNFSSLPYDKVYSSPFVIGGCKWYITYPKGNKFNNSLSLYLVVDDSRSLPCGWKRFAQFSLTIVNQHTENLSQRGEKQHWFNQRNLGSGFTSMLPLPNLHAKHGGFLVNGEVKIVVEIDVLEVIGNFDVSEESEEENQPLKKIKLDNDDNDAVSIDFLNVASPVMESIDVNGFQVLPSQVESVKCIFERHPDFASRFRPKNRHLKSSYMNVLLGLIKTLCQLPEELSDDDLEEASVAVSYVEKGGFKLDWLEKKLAEVKAKKKKVEIGKARLQQTEEELHRLNQRCLDLKALLEKETADVSEANVPLSFDDVV